MHVIGYQTINIFQGWLSTFNWPNLIAKVEAKYLEIFKIHSIYIEVSKRIKIDIANVFSREKSRMSK